MASALVPVLVAAQTPRPAPDSTSATGVSAAFFDAVVGARWGDAAVMFDAAPLEQIRQQIANRARFFRKRPPVTAAQLMRADPKMPRAVAAFRAREINENVRAQAGIIDVFGVNSPDSLLALPIQAFGARWLEVQDERWVLTEAERRCDHDAAHRQVRVEPYRILGAVADDSLTYVLYDPGESRAPTLDPRIPRSPRTLVLRRSGSSWSIIPREGLVGVGDMVNACG